MGVLFRPMETMVRVHLEEIWWHVNEGEDVTNLPFEAMIDLDMEDIMDQDEFWEAAENELENLYNVRPNGFRYTIIHDTFH